MKNENTSIRLKRIMNERQMKQVDILNAVQPLCKKYGEKINKSHLSQWVSGANEPNQRKLTILAQALDVSEVWLMGYDLEEKEEEINAGDILASIYKDKQVMEYTEKLIQLNTNDREIVFNMIDALLKKGE